MIGRGHVTFLDDDAVRVINRYIRDGVLRRAERDGIHVVDPEVIAFSQIAAKLPPKIGKSARGPALERPDPADAESDRDLLTVRQAASYLPWGAHEIRRKIRAGEIPIRQRDPYLLSRDMVLAIASTQDHRGAA